MVAQSDLARSAPHVGDVISDAYTGSPHPPLDEQVDFAATASTWMVNPRCLSAGDSHFLFRGRHAANKCISAVVVPKPSSDLPCGQPKLEVSISLVVFGTLLSLADRGAAPPFVCRAGSSALLPCRFIRTAAVPVQSFPLPAVSLLIRHRHRCTKRVFYKSKSDPGRGNAGIGPSVPQPRSFSNWRLRPRLRRTMAFPWVLHGLVAETIAGVGWEEEVQGDRRLGQHVRCQSHSFGTRPRGQTS